MTVLGLITNTPEWARKPGTSFSHPPIKAADYAEFVSAVVKRYQDRISDWEIWNEPNLPRFFGFSDLRPAGYVALLQAAYPAIKLVQPNSTVIVAGLSPAVGVDAPPNFLNDMYIAGAKGSFDAIAMHPYVYPGGIVADSTSGWSDIARVHDVMTVHGDGNMKIWMTELGAPTASATDEGVQPGGAGQADPRRAGRIVETGLQRTGLHLLDPGLGHGQSRRRRGQLRRAADHRLSTEVRGECARPLSAVATTYSPWAVTARIVGEVGQPQEVRVAGRPIHTFEVIRSEQLTPHMIRLVLGGTGFDTFMPNDFTDSYVKIVIVRDDVDVDALPAPLTLDSFNELPAEHRPVVRTYTVRNADADRREITIDFVVHGEQGVAGPVGRVGEPGQPAI